MSATKMAHPNNRIDDIHRSFRQTGDIRLRSIAVHATSEGVRLTGCVSSFYCKQLAQTLAMATPGIEQVDNRVDVV